MRSIMPFLLFWKYQISSSAARKFLLGRALGARDRAHCLCIRKGVREKVALHVGYGVSGAEEVITFGLLEVIRSYQKLSFLQIN